MARPPKTNTVAAGVALATLTAVVGCAHPMQRKLEGRWFGESVENFDDEVVAAATGWAKGTTMEFSGSRIRVCIPAEEERAGSYKVERVRDRNVHLVVERPDGSHDRVHFKLDSDHSLRWLLGDGRAIVMRRDG